MTTLLEGVNKVLRRTQIITSDLTSFTSSGKQPWIDTCIYAWNEAVIEVYDLADKPLPQELASSTITLVTDTRDYSLASDVIKLRFPMKDLTNGYYLYEYPGGYMQMRSDQIFESNETGQPYYGAIDPTDGSFYMDRIPTSNENGNIFTYWYDKDLELSATTDTFPFNNHVYLALANVVAEKWREENKQTFNKPKHDYWLAKAASFLNQTERSSSWLPQRWSVNPDMNDPYGD